MKFDNYHVKMAREIIENGIIDSSRGLQFTITHEHGKRIKYWLGAIDHLVRQLHNIE
jgi:hypothetical protein